MTARRQATPQQLAVRDILAGEQGFLSAQDVYARLRLAGQSVGIATVYRHLQSFADQGLTDVIHGAGGELAYRLCGNATQTRHHHHLVCRRCGRTEEVTSRAVERWAAEVGAQHGFTDVEHTVEVVGTCAACAAALAQPPTTRDRARS
jgi:Fur family ferric uptake transcriptional regulator